MASLHKDPRGLSPFWYCAVTLPGGKRIYRSTKQVSKKKAWDFARGLERLAERRNFITETQAKKCVDLILEQVGEDTLPDTTIFKYFTKWCNEQKVMASSSTYVRYKVIIEKFLESLGARADMPLGALRPADITDFRSMTVSSGKSKTTANLEMKIIKIPLTRARKQGYILVNPADSIEPLKTTQKSRDVFTKKQVGDLLSNASEDWKGMILLGFTYGVRIQDAAHLTWGNIDMEKELLEFIPSKTKGRAKKSQVTPLTADVLTYLKSRTQGVPAAPLFPTLHKKRVGGNCSLCADFIDIMKKAGISDRKDQAPDVKGLGRHFFALGFHSLRHTCVSLLRNKGVDSGVSRQIVGHTSDVHEQYTHWELESMKVALDKLPRFKIN